ncbi:MAG: hypothetical protein B7X35_04445 [Halothiobacillus sp. 14-56-357]|jgi:hypothetical protein|uniref:DUF1109 domain-containing protein n=1 Tax=Halothiobacillus sp. 15-55-196 TaxID=1970382 RepID=UPI000BD4F617|nr:DUF1109 domain-containing protein [Halothiobacillus sp. 15-55-196]OZB35883.1 MAG: hypothetical protein B7X44_08250 [Halothiobacillus sp. 15-55-196]OZB56693.1 MAG: hypothetical protein B7X35_04445 [Halothiobacillus sp. 14-56-357]OZB79265.1 MAG: hypothetical protein B7X29_01590 [Halothiobacillus sp. 13-55-115]
MKTDDLILMLAQGEVAVPRHVVAKRLSMALGVGLFASFGLMLAVLGLRPDLESASMLPMFWVKLAFSFSMGLIGLIAVKKVARPEGAINRTLWAIAFPIGLIWLLSLILVAHAPTNQRWHMFFGENWYECPLLITMLSAPIFIALLWAMRSLAPTQLVLAGAAVGLMSGGWGAVVYSLHCLEMGAPFIGTWYLLGILIPTVIGALLGKTLLRW